MDNKPAEVHPVRKILLSALAGSLDGTANKMAMAFKDTEALGDFFARVADVFKISMGTTSAANQPLEIPADAQILFGIENDRVWVSFSGGVNKLEIEYPNDLPFHKAPVVPIKKDE